MAGEIITTPDWQTLLAHGSPQVAPYDTCGPWPITDKNFAPSLLQRTQHALCEAETAIAGAGASVGRDARATLDWLWERLQTLWGDVVTVGSRTWDAAKDEAVALWHDTTDFLNWLYGRLTTWGLWAAAIVLGLFFLPEILEGGAFVAGRTISSAHSVKRHYRRGRGTA